MKMHVGRFREALELLSQAVARKPSLKSLEHVMLKDGQAVATDMETMVILTLPEADIDSLVPIKGVMQVLQYVPGRELVHLESKKGKLSLSWSDGSASFPGMDTQEYPPVPEFTPVAEESLNSDILIPAMAAVQSYAATESDRPVLQGVTLILGDPVEVAAGDGFRMAHKVLTISYPEKVTTIVPQSSVSVLNYLWKKTPRTPSNSDALVPALMTKKQVVVAYDGEKGLRFQFNPETAAIVKLVIGKPPDWLKLIPRGEPVLKVHVLAPELELAIRRVKEVAQAGGGIVRMVFENSDGTISAKGDDLEVQSSIKTLNAEGVPNKVALSVGYLLSYLKGKEGIISLSWTGGSAPVSFQSQNSPSVLIMPMTPKDW